MRIQSVMRDNEAYQASGTNVTQKCKHLSRTPINQHVCMPYGDVADCCYHIWKTSHYGSHGSPEEEGVKHINTFDTANVGQLNKGCIALLMVPIRYTPMVSQK